MHVKVGPSNLFREAKRHAKVIEQFFAKNVIQLGR